MTPPPSHTATTVSSARFTLYTDTALVATLPSHSSFWVLPGRIGSHTSATFHSLVIHRHCHGSRCKDHIRLTLLPLSHGSVLLEFQGAAATVQGQLQNRTVHGRVERGQQQYDSHHGLLDAPVHRRTVRSSPQPAQGPAAPSSPYCDPEAANAAPSLFEWRQQSLQCLGHGRLGIPSPGRKGAEFASVPVLASNHQCGR